MPVHSSSKRERGRVSFQNIRFTESRTIAAICTLFPFCISDSTCALRPNHIHTLDDRRLM